MYHFGNTEYRQYTKNIGLAQKVVAVKRKLNQKLSCNTYYSVLLERLEHPVYNINLVTTINVSISL